MNLELLPTIFFFNCIQVSCFSRSWIWLPTVRGIPGLEFWNILEAAISRKQTCSVLEVPGWGSKPRKTPTAHAKARCLTYVDVLPLLTPKWCEASHQSETFWSPEASKPRGWAGQFLVVDIYRWISYEQFSWIQYDMAFSRNSLYPWIYCTTPSWLSHAIVSRPKNDGHVLVDSNTKAVEWVDDLNGWVW